MLSSASAMRFFARADFSMASVCLRLRLNIELDVDGGLIRVVLMWLFIKPAPARPLTPGVF